MAATKHSDTTIRLDAYLTIEGSKQGKFKGDSQKDASKIVVLDFDFGAKAPRDLATGQASGKRQYSLFKFTSHLGPTTPQLMQACATGEVLKSAEFTVYRTSASGVEEVGTKVKLTKATIAEYEVSGAGGITSPVAHDFPLVHYAMSFQSISFENTSGKTMMADDWHA
jgi:type VI secretion system secreted protein Hcp